MRTISLMGIVFFFCACTASDNRPPNVVIIFVDDLGYADLGDFSQLPHLGQMASSGMQFTNFYVASAACSPSRAALLTGMYPHRVGIPGVLMPQSTTGLHARQFTLAEMLRDHAFATACFGKWHLGHMEEYLPANHGFDHYFGIPYSNDMTPDATKNPNPFARRHPPLPLVEGTRVVEEEPDQAQLTRRYTQRAVRFIEENSHRPFFLYFPHTFMHVPLFASEYFQGRSGRGLYGDVLMEIDWSVGRIMRTLDDLDLTDNTLVVFTSDNGPWLIKGDHSGSALPLREGKGTTFEGGHRVPFIVQWPGVIPSGTTSHEMITAMDIMPTIAALTGAPVPENHPFDGKDITSLFMQVPDARSPHEAFFFYHHEELQAVRSGSWKLHIPHRFRSIRSARLSSPDHPGAYVQDSIGLALFDLNTDIGETTNVASENPEMVEKLLGLIEDAR